MSSTPSLRDLKFESYDVGQNIKASKKLFKWTFYMNGNKQIVELFQSKISGKRKAMHNGNFLYEDMSYNVDFSYSFYIDKIYCNIIQIDDDRFEFRIMNRAFSILMEEEKNKYSLNNDDYDVINKKQSFPIQNESSNSQSSSKFEFPKFLKSSNKKSVSQVAEEKNTNVFKQTQNTQQAQIKKNVSMNVPSSTSTLNKEPVTNEIQATSLINMDDIFSNTQNNKGNLVPSKNNADLFAQIDLISSNSSNNNNTFNMSNNSSLLNNYNNSFQNNSINQQFNIGNNTMNNYQNPNQYYPFNDLNTLSSSNSPNMWINQSSSQNEFSGNPNNKQTVIMFENKSENVQQKPDSYSNLNEYEIKSVNSVSTDNELKKRLFNNNKLVDINNLLDNKKQTSEEKPNNNSILYAYSGTPLNAIKIDNGVTNEKKLNLGNVGLQSDINVSKFNSSGNFNPMYSGLNNQMNQMYNNQMGYGFQPINNNNMGMFYNNQMNQNINYNPYPNNVNSNNVNSIFK